MSNTFYKPKNEFGELLISEIAATTIIDGVKKSLTEKIEETDASLVEKINKTNDKLNTRIDDEVENLNNIIETKEAILKNEITRVDEKHSLQIEEIAPADAPDLHEYFRIEMQNRWELAKLQGTIKEFAYSLAKTVFIIKSNAMPCSCGHECTCDDIYEEYICINPNGITSEEAPKFTRLGAVDSIIATHRSPGSSVLVSDIYNTEFWEDYGKVGTPLAGRSVAPIALKAFVDADKAIIEEHNNFKAETTDDIFAIRDQLKVLETEVYDTQEENQAGESRIDRLEKIIGVNACCDNDDACDLPHHGASDCCEPGCNILCKINDINIRLDDNNNNDIEQSAAIEAANETIAALSDSVDARFDEVNSSIASLDEKHANDIKTVQTRIDSEVEQINVTISETNASLDDAHNRITTLDNKHKSDLNLNAEEHAEIMRNVSANKAAADTKFYEIDKVDAAQNTEIGRIEDKIDREISDRLALAGQYSDLNNRVNDIHTDCISIRSDIDAHEASAASTHAKLNADIAKNAENLEIAKVQNAGEHSMFSTKIENAERKISEIQNSLNSHTESSQTEINSLKTRTTALETSVSTLNASVNEIEINTGSLSSRVAQIGTALESNIKQADDNSKDITEIKNRLNLAENSIASNNVERIKDINDIADSLTAEVAARTSADIDTQAVCKQYTDRLVNEHTATINDKLVEKLDVETFETSISDINEDIDEIKKELSEHKVDSTASFTSLDSRLTAAKNDIDRINPQVTANTLEIENLIANDATNLQYINELRNDVNTCNDNIVSLTSADEIIKSDLDEVKDELTEISTSFETLKNLVDTRRGNINIFGKISLVNGNAIISKEKILNRIDAGEESNWIITVNSVQEESPEGELEIIYPEIKYTTENIEITFGDKPTLNILVSFVGINTTTNDIITL